MKQRLATAPLWVLFIVNAFAAGVVSGAVDQSVRGGVVFALVWGIFATRFEARQRRGKAPTALGKVPPQFRSAVQDASWHGPVPADANVRGAAADLADYQRATVVHARTVVVPLTVLGIAGCLVLVITGGAGWILPAAVLFVPLAVVLFWPNHLARRVMLLRS